MFVCERRGERVCVRDRGRKREQRGGEKMSACATEGQTPPKNRQVECSLNECVDSELWANQLQSDAHTR